jgi:hypothetical protein
MLRNPPLLSDRSGKDTYKDVLSNIENAIVSDIQDNVNGNYTGRCVEQVILRRSRIF